MQLQTVFIFEMYKPCCFAFLSNYTQMDIFHVCWNPNMLVRVVRNYRYHFSNSDHRCVVPLSNWTKSWIRPDLLLLNNYTRAVQTLSCAPFPKDWCAVIVYVAVVISRAITYVATNWCKHTYSMVNVCPINRMCRATLIAYIYIQHFIHQTLLAKPFGTIISSNDPTHSIYTYSLTDYVLPDIMFGVGY